MRSRCAVSLTPRSAASATSSATFAMFPRRRPASGSSLAGVRCRTCGWPMSAGPTSTTWTRSSRTTRRMCRSARTSRRCRRLAALGRGLGGHHQWPTIDQAVLRPPVEDGRPQCGDQLHVGNGGPTLDQRSVIDAGFLELLRLGLEPANDLNIVRSLPVVDATIKMWCAHVRYEGSAKRRRFS